MGYARVKLKYPKLTLIFLIYNVFHLNYLQLHSITRKYVTCDDNTNNGTYKLFDNSNLTKLIKKQTKGISSILKVA